MMYSPWYPNYYGMPAQQGGTCPKCGRVNAPWVATCPCYSSGGSLGPTVWSGDPPGTVSSGSTTSNQTNPGDWTP